MHRLAPPACETHDVLHGRDRGIVGIDIAGPESATFRVADYRRLFRRARQFGLGLTVHTGEAGPVDEVARVVQAAETCIV